MNACSRPVDVYSTISLIDYICKHLSILQEFQLHITSYISIFKLLFIASKCFYIILGNREMLENCYSNNSIRIVTAPKPKNGFNKFSGYFFKLFLQIYIMTNKN